MEFTPTKSQLVYKNIYVSRAPFGALFGIIVLMHSIWDGSINFGLVNIPIRMYSGANTHEGLHFDMLRKSDNSPIHYKRFATADNKEVPYEDIVKGYQVEKGSYVVITPDDFEKANVHKAKNISIQQFVGENEIDSRYYEKPYYLEPAKNAEKTYILLRDALEVASKVALASFVIRGRENLATIRPIGGVLVLNQIRFASDLRSLTSLNIPDDKPSKEELKMALELITKGTKHFIAEDWHDTYTEELIETIKAKSKGKLSKVKTEVPRPTEVKDIVKALKASLDR